MTRDAADSERLADAVGQILPALTQFNRFEGPDLTAREKDRWLAVVDTPLPEQGEGLDAVLETLSGSIIPNGLRMGSRGFSGWITGQPTTSGTVATLAQTIAGPQRFFLHSFNALEDVALRWLAQLLGIPFDLRGVFTSGGCRSPRWWRWPPRAKASSKGWGSILRQTDCRETTSGASTPAAKCITW
jgi:aromatic-L-amino-acid/L-tryptophan decarboxylase